MDNQQHNGIVSFIWSIADDCLRDVYVRGKYRDVILPMVVMVYWEMSNKEKSEAKNMTDKQNIENWMSMKSITEYLDVSRETVLQWINNRNMPAHKVGRLWKFKVSEVDEWIRSGGAAEKNGPDN